MITRHPDPELLVDYTSGSLAIAPSIAVTTHLHLCTLCRSAVATLDQVAGDLFTKLDATPVSASLRARVMEEINTNPDNDNGNDNETNKSLDGIAQALPDYVNRLLPDGKLNWKFLSPSVRVANLSIGETAFELALHRIKAGGKAPEHNHTGEEITVVLTGTFSDEDGIYQPGDFILRDAGEVHRPIAAQNAECICLSVLAAPIQLTGVNKLLNPFLSFSPS